MAETGKRTDPLTAFRFKVSIGQASGGFSECSGLAVDTEIFEYAEGGRNESVHKLPTRHKQGDITLKRGIVGAKLWNWCLKSSPGAMTPTAGSIELQDSSGKTVLTWNLERAFPKKIQGPDMNAGQSAVAVETLEISHHGLTVSGKEE